MYELDLTRTQWRRSSYSSGNGQCVEVADLPEAVAVRDSKDPAEPKLSFSHQAWAAFVERTKDGRPLLLNCGGSGSLEHLVEVPLQERAL